MPKRTPKQIAFDLEAQMAAKKGVEKLSRAVKSTLGPVGSNAVIDRGWGEPIITKDGASVAEEVDLVDPYENMAAKLVREAAEKTANEAGDGSTTATLLAESIFKKGLQNVIAGMSPMILSRGIRMAVDSALGSLKELSTPVKSKDQLVHLATVAANQDSEIGQTIADAFESVGEDGVITIEEGKEVDTLVESVEGMEFDRGYLSPHFITDGDKMLCELEKPYILIFEEKLTRLEELLPLLEKVLAAKRSLLVVAEDVEGEVLSALVVNKLKGVLPCAAVKAPAYGERRKAMLQDLAILTGGKAIFKDVGMKLESLELADLGEAGKIRITSEDTIIVGGGGESGEVEARANEIRRELEETESEYDQEKLQERLAKLVGGVCVIHVGAATESDMKEQKSRFESALNATRAGQSEGLLPGGGVGLFRAAEALDGLDSDGLTSEEQAGRAVIRAALETPIRQLCENSGVEPATILRQIRSADNVNLGCNLASDKVKVVDMLEEGVIDATKVVRAALQNAASVATLLLTSDTMIAEIPHDEDEDDHHHHHHDDGMGMGGMGGMG